MGNKSSRSKKKVSNQQKIQEESGKKKEKEEKKSIEEEEEEEESKFYSINRGQIKIFKDFKKYEREELQNYFLGFRCKECFKQLKLTLKNNEKYILFECENKDHSNESTLKDLLIKNRIIITPDYNVEDDFYLERKDKKFFNHQMFIDYMKPEFLYIVI